MTPNAGNAVRIRPLTHDDTDRCDAIARKLPDWFGIEEGLVELRRSVERGPGYVALSEETVVGFVTLESPFSETWEITWMAVAPDQHRRGTGRALVEAVASDARAAGVRLLHVKTLAGSHPSSEYARPRAFYGAMGFHRMVIVPELWDPVNPCLLMVKPL